MNLRVLLHIKDGSLKKKELEGFMFGSGSAMEKKKKSEGRGTWIGKENGASGSGMNKVASNAGVVQETRVGKRMRQSLWEVYFLCNIQDLQSRMESSSIDGDSAKTGKIVDDLVG